MRKNLSLDLRWWLLLGLWTLGQLQRIEFSIGYLIIPIYVHELLMIAWLGSELKSLKKALELAKTFLESRKYLKLFLSWLVIAVMVKLALGNESLLMGLYLLRVAFYLMFILVASLKINTPKRMLLLREKLVVAGLISLGLGLLQYFLLPDTRFLKILGWDDHYYRMIGALFDPGFLGAVLVITWGYLSSLKWLQKLKYSPYILHGLVAAGISITYSRASYLSFVILLLSIIFTNKSKAKDWLKISAFSVVCFMLALYVAPKPTGEGVDLRRTSTINSRAEVASQVISGEMIDIMIGSGLKGTKSEAENPLNIPDHAHVADNIFLLVFQFSGVIGLTLFLFWILREGRGLAKSSPIFFSILLATLAHAQFNNTLLEPFVMLYLLSGGISLQKS